jgi:hypothetical protein
LQANAKKSVTKTAKLKKAHLLANAKKSATKTAKLKKAHLPNSFPNQFLKAAGLPGSFFCASISEPNHAILAAAV